MADPKFTNAIGPVSSPGDILRAAARVLDVAEMERLKRLTAKPMGWLYDWTSSSALGKSDEHFTGFTTDEAHARKHDNVRPVYAHPTGAEEVARSCTCHPDDNLPRPCPRKFALSECRAAPGVALPDGAQQ